MLMAYNMSTLSKILSSNIRAELFRLFFGIRDKALHMREIERQTGFAIGTIQSELKKLAALELISKRRDGNRVYFAANPDHPLYPEIHGMVLKTNGLVDLLKVAIGHVEAIRIAFVFGSVADQREKPQSDVDVMVIGDLGLRQLTRLLSGMPEKIGREINPHILSEKEYVKRIRAHDHFITAVLTAKKLFIKGSEHDLGKLAA
jgi:DNA-binding transcriptional ArsR family regulator